MGYAFEQLGPQRRAPFSTPPLVAGKAPASMTFTTTAANTTRRAATARFTFDRVTGTLGYDLDVRGLPGVEGSGGRVRRRDAAGRGRVVQRLSGPDDGVGFGEWYR